jgi:hypothetical protein
MAKEVKELLALEQAKYDQDLDDRMNYLLLTLILRIIAIRGCIPVNLRWLLRRILNYRRKGALLDIFPQRMIIPRRNLLPLIMILFW